MSALRSRHDPVAFPFTGAAFAACRGVSELLTVPRSSCAAAVIWCSDQRSENLPLRCLDKRMSRSGFGTAGVGGIYCRRACKNSLCMPCDSGNKPLRWW